MDGRSHWQDSADCVVLDRPTERTSPNSLREILAINGRVLVAAEWKRESVEKSVKKLKRAEGWFEVVKYFRNAMQVIRILLKEGDTTGEIPDKKRSRTKKEPMTKSSACRNHAGKLMDGWAIRSSAFRKMPRPTRKLRWGFKRLLQIGWAASSASTAMPMGRS
jgi:hypothetical protein